MNIIGLVCEYNPFHKGHAWQIEASREALGEDSVIVCAMSGDYVQRGEAAIFSKFARAEAACRCGADLVFELPLPWAISSAEGFARGAVSMLAGLGCNYLSFGSEHGSLDMLEQLACRLNRKNIIEEIKQLMDKEPRLSFAAARQQLLAGQLGEAAALLEKPNNILAVEYLKAIKQLNLSLRPFTLERRGSGHDQPGEGELRSASELRDMLRLGKDPSEHIPEAAMEVFRRELQQGRSALDEDRRELALMSRLRMLEENSYLSRPDGGDGAGRRLYSAVKTAGSLEEILKLTAARRIPLARVRRMCLCAALGVEKGLADGIPPYARLLAANEKGRRYLRDIDNKTTIYVVTKPAHVKYLGPQACNLFALGASAHDMFTLLYASQKDRFAGQDWRIGPKIV